MTAIDARWAATVAMYDNWLDCTMGVESGRQDLKDTRQPYDPARVRPEHLIRPGDRRREFATREAQRRLQQIERPRWALVAYAVFLLAIALIGGVTYTTYAFSKYRGEILPGVYVDHRSLAGLTESQAERLLTNQLESAYFSPVTLTYADPIVWRPKSPELGYHPDPRATAMAAIAVGRQGNLLAQLLDRLPIHRQHEVPLVYTVDDARLKAYVLSALAATHQIHRNAQNADLRVDKTDHIQLVPSRPGLVLDVPATIRAIHHALGHLTPQTVALPVDHMQPVITDTEAQGIRARVEQFLSHPPIINIGKRVFVTSRFTFAPMLSFKPVVTKQRATILMQVNADQVQVYVSRLAQQVDRNPRNPRASFFDGKVQMVSREQNGRTLNQTVTNAKLLAVITALKPNARLRFRIATVRPAIDTTNPASLGINTWLSTGVTSFLGAGMTRLTDIQNIASRLNNVLLSPGQNISFNTLVTTDWPNRVYLDQEQDKHGRLVPGPGGAMQQVATTFLRALYGAGLQVVERHPHAYRLAWYEPPIGLDAVVTPDGQEDLSFHNNTGKSLLLQTRVEPLRQELYIYVYGPKLGWQVSIDNGRVSRVFPHGPTIVKQDTSLTPGTVQQIAFAHDGANTVVTRTITYPNGNVTVDKLHSHYQPWNAIMVMGSLPAKPTATPKTKTTPQPTTSATPPTPATPTPTAPATATPAPVSTATFNH